MKLYTTDSLFPWDRLQDAPDLQSIRLFFEALPAGRLLEALNTARGKGRDDCPAQVLLFCALLQPLLRHTTMSATLAVLGRNPVLRQLGGMPELADIPNRCLGAACWQTPTRPLNTRSNSAQDRWAFA